MDMQKLMDAMSAMGATTRSGYHLTLGKAAELAEQATGEVRFEDGKYPGEEYSYRGYYSDLAFEATESPVSAKDFAAQCRKAIGSTYEGYKGGDFRMTETTPLWRSPYGISSSEAIIAGIIDQEGNLLLRCHNVND